MDPREKAMASAAARVGLADEVNVIRKALELERLLATRMTAGVGFSDTGRNILCLDLAAAAMNLPVDTASLVKHSGMKKPTYLNSRAAAESLLQMRTSLSASGVCLKLQCVAAQGLTEKILDTYQKTQEIDLSNPQYVCMAVYQACRILKIKVSKTKLLSQSMLKPQQWARLEGAWTKFSDENFGKDKPAKCLVSDSFLSECVDSIEMNTEAKQKELQKNKTENYDVWKQRILKEAYEELRELENKKGAALCKMDAASRKSPRKREDDTEPINKGNKEKTETTPRKSPRKREEVTTPKMDRSKGVRILFN